MNLNHLAIFHAVAQTGSMTLGAERLDISQPFQKCCQGVEDATPVTPNHHPPTLTAFLKRTT
jgi:hypothetical protein